MTARSQPVAHRGKVRLYRPTEAIPSWRLVWSDPLTGERVHRRFPDELSAMAAFDDACAYVDVAQTSPRPRRRSGPPTVSDLFEATHADWVASGDTGESYRQGRRGLFATWIEPICGEVLVRDWMASNEYCRAVIGAVRSAGRAPATVQNVGGLMRKMVTTAHDRPWASLEVNPMRNVRYTAKAVVRDGALYVPPSARPTTAMVDALADALDLFGAKRDMPWLGDMARVAAFAGPRFGEQTAVRAVDYHPDDNRLEVATAWTQPSGKQPTLKLPKNGHVRSVLLPGVTSSRPDRPRCGGHRAARHERAALPGAKRTNGALDRE